VGLGIKQGNASRQNAKTDEERTKNVGEISQNGIARTRCLDPMLSNVFLCATLNAI
jgi:hypothetical protein